MASRRPHFDLVDLTLFVNVAAAQSLTKGADETALSLAAASMRIKNIEMAVGAQLLHRTKRGVTLTLAGTIFQHHAKAMLQQLNALYDDIQEHYSSTGGHVRLFANVLSVAEALPAALGAFLAAHPQVTVDVEEIESPEIVRLVREGAGDIGIISGRIDADGLETIPYKSQSWVLATAKTHPLATAGLIRFADATAYDFVTLQARSAAHVLFRQLTVTHGFKIKVRARVTSFEAVARMIAGNVGIGLLPRELAFRLARSLDLAIIVLADEWAERPMRICVRRLAGLPIFARQLAQHLADDAIASASAGLIARGEKHQTGAVIWP
jgi:DNA-binding transcriptional LysR family regulator